jgi:uncharacterized protein (DUF362 family)
MTTTPKPTVHTSVSEDFVYHPPDCARDAQQILIKPNIGYPVGPPATVSMHVLGKVIEGLRQANPAVKILIVEGVCSKTSFATIMAKNGVHSLLTEGVELLDADSLEIVEYPNRSPNPVRFPSMWAPRLLQEVDCCLSVSAFKRTQLKGEPLISASLKNLYGLFPRAKYKARSSSSRGQLHRPSVPLVLQDVYYTIGHFFEGAVVDCTQKFVSHDWKPDRGKAVSIGQVIWGDDLLAVDRLACKVGQEDVPSYITDLERQVAQMALM